MGGDAATETVANIQPKRTAAAGPAAPHAGLLAPVLDATLPGVGAGPILEPMTLPGRCFVARRAAASALLLVAATAARGQDACSPRTPEPSAPLSVRWAEAEPHFRALIAVSPATNERITLLVQCSGAGGTPESSARASAPAPVTLHDLVLEAFQRERASDASFEQRLRSRTVEAARLSREKGTDDMAAYRARLQATLQESLFRDREWVARLQAAFSEVLDSRGRRCPDCAHRPITTEAAGAPPDARP